MASTRFYHYSDSAATFADQRADAILDCLRDLIRRGAFTLCEALSLMSFDKDAAVPFAGWASVPYAQLHPRLTGPAKSNVNPDSYMDGEFASGKHQALLTKYLTLVWRNMVAKGAPEMPPPLEFLKMLEMLRSALEENASELPEIDYCTERSFMLISERDAQFLVDCMKLVLTCDHTYDYMHQFAGIMRYGLGYLKALRLPELIECLKGPDGEALVSECMEDGQGCDNLRNRAIVRKYLDEENAQKARIAADERIAQLAAKRDARFYRMLHADAKTVEACNRRAKEDMYPFVKALYEPLAPVRAPRLPHRVSAPLIGRVRQPSRVRCCIRPTSVNPMVFQPR